MFVFVVLQSYTNMHVLLLTPLVMLQFEPWCHPRLASLSYSIGQGISLQSNQVLKAFCPRIKIWFCWIRFWFELLKLKSKNGLLESSLDLNNQILLEYRTMVAVSWTLEDACQGEMCSAVFTNLESLSRSLFQCKNRLYLFSTKVFSKAEIAKELRWRVLLLVRF